MTIKKKLIAALILVALIPNLIVIAMLSLLVKVDSEYKLALNSHGFVQGSIGKIGMDSNEIYGVLSSVQNGGSIDQSATQVEENLKEISELYNEIKSQCDEDQQKEVEALGNKISEYKIKCNDIISSYSTEKLKNLKQYSDDVDTEVTNLLEDIDKDADKIILELKQLETKSKTINFIVISLDITIVVLLILHFNKTISIPIIKLAEVAKEIAKGNLNVESEISGEDEIGSLSKDMNSIISYLNEIFATIKMTSTQVASGSYQLAESAQGLSEGATNQASSLLEISASMNMINEKVHNNAEDTKNIGNLTDELLDNIENSNIIMDKMLNAMKDIEKSSKDISQIIQTIDDIASQTNLLALNAAIEATHAGDAGNGFAVVADQVRRLSHESSIAAKNTADLIENTKEVVNNGKSLADDTSNELKQIVVKAKKVSEIIAHIIEDGKEEAKSINEINTSITQISDVVNSNSAISEENAAACEELTAQAKELEESVADFKLKK